MTLYGTDTITEVIDGQTYENIYEGATYYNLKQSELEEELLDDNRNGFMIYSDDYGLVFDDGLFNSGDVSFDLVIFNPFNRMDEQNTIIKSYIRVELRSINEDYFEYQRSHSLQQQTVDNPLAEPVFIYNNINNGFGNFSAYNSMTKIIMIK